MLNNFLQKLAYYDGKKYLKKSLAQGGNEQSSDVPPEWVMDVRSGGNRGGSSIKSNQAVAHSTATINFNDPIADPSMVRENIKLDAIKKLINEYAILKNIKPSMISLKSEPKLEWHDDKKSGRAYVKATCPTSNFAIGGASYEASKRKSLGDKWKITVIEQNGQPKDELLHKRFAQIDMQNLNPSLAKSLKEEAIAFINNVFKYSEAATIVKEISLDPNLDSVKKEKFLKELSDKREEFKSADKETITNAVKEIKKRIFI